MKRDIAMQVQSSRNVRTRTLLQRLARSGAVLGASGLLAANGLIATSGCSGTSGFDGEEIGTRSQDLHGDAWRTWITGMFANTDVSSDPALCNPGTAISYFVATQNTDSRYYLKSVGRAHNPSWKQFGTRQFNSAPTCTSQKLASPTDSKFLLAGRSTNGLIYSIEGVQPAPTDIAPPNPDWTGAWAQVSGTAYTGSNGVPALGSNGSRIILAFKNGNRISVHQQALPYSSTNWNAVPINSPTFPSGVTVSGVPAVVYISGSTNKFTIMVRGVTPEDVGFYWINFNGTAFEGSWARAFIPGTIDSDPSMEYDSQNNALTLYYRSGNEVIQTSVEVPGELGVRPFHAIPNLSNAVLRGAPRAAWPAGIEGIRTVIIRGYNDLVSSNRNRHIMSTETKGAPSPF